jgi:hypothetical protein
MTWAATNGVPVRFIDLPAGVMLSEAAADRAGATSEGATPEARTDPFAVLARLVGIEDPERWWDEVAESAPDSDRFAAVADLMTELRASTPVSVRSGPAGDAVREAAMRQHLRAARREFSRVAVVCGAWHVPALADPLPPARDDTASLKGLPKVKCQLAWVPWTHARLASASGYGAGIDSPGWYHHLFSTDSDVVVRWLTASAAVLRDHDLPISSAHVIEAARLATSLAAMRGRALPGLPELDDATLAVLCEGNTARLALIGTRLVVGDRLGNVPEGAPLVPLDTDLRARAKTLRLAFAAEPKELTLDLRRDFDRRRSELLHRLAILDIDWGEPRSESSTGTFKEAWTLAWDPALAVKVVEAATWGTTVEVAASRRLEASADSLPDVGRRIGAALAADLPDAMQSLLSALDRLAAASGDVSELLGALGPLARAARYGNVRGTDTSRLARVADSVLVRACAGLAAAVSGLGDDAARELVGLFEDAQRAVWLLDDDARATWTRALTDVVDRGDAPAMLVGRAVRLLLDSGAISSAETAGRLSRALSGGHGATYQASWAEGLLAGDALLLIHDETLLPVLDAWVTGLPEGAFTDAVPVLRRTFGRFQRSERRRLELQIRRLAGGTARRDGTADTALDVAAAASVLETVRRLLTAGRQSDDGQ